MAQIMNKILTNIYDFLLKTFESRLIFKKELVNIKIEEKRQKVERLKSRIEVKNKHILSKFESEAGFESDYINLKISEKVQELENTIYWQRRVINQKIKRAKDNLKLESLRIQLEQLDSLKTSEVEKIKAKYLNNNPTELQIMTCHAQQEEIKQAQEIRFSEIEEKYDTYVKKITDDTDKIVNKYQERLDYFAGKLIKLENSLKKSKSIEILDNSIALSIRNLSMHFGGLKAVDDLSFEVKTGEIFGLIGPNGAGKTTVFNCITRFYKPTAGEMYFNNFNQKTVYLNKVKVHNIIKEGIVRTFQNVELVWELNILDNLLVAAHSAFRSNFFGHSVHSRLTKREEEIFTKRATKILNDLNLLPYAYAYPLGLPYGVLKKVELARTLMSNPKLIILDEPAAGLNDVETKELADFIKKIKDEYNVTIFLVEHDMGLVMSICDTVCAISFGKKLAIGTPKEIQNSKVVREAYLGGD